MLSDVNESSAKDRPSKKIKYENDSDQDDDQTDKSGSRRAVNNKKSDKS